MGQMQTREALYLKPFVYLLILPSGLYNKLGIVRCKCLEVSGYNKKNIVFFCMNNLFIFTNSVYPDETCFKVVPGQVNKKSNLS